MSFDPLFLCAVVDELQRRIVPAAVDKVLQPGVDEVVLRLWTGREKLRLLISVAPRTARLHLVAGRLPNPAAPPRFCQLLRARLSRLLAIERPPGERIVHLVLAGAGGEGYRLVAELFGPRPNLILVGDDGAIVDALHRREEGRAILPGIPYAPPPLPQRSDLEQGLPSIPPDAPFADWLAAAVTPLSPLAIADLTAAVAAGLPPAEALQRLHARLAAREFAPARVTLPGGESVLTPFPPDFVELAAVERFPGASQAAEACYAAAGELFLPGADELARLIRRAMARMEKRLAQIARDAERAAAAAQHGRLGELLLANLHALRRGTAVARVTDWYADPPVPVDIPLDPRLTPRENAEALFRLARKGKRAAEHIARRRSETEAERAWLDSILQGLAEATSDDDLAAIRDELVENGLLRLTHPGPRRRAQSGDAAAGVRQAATANGYRLLWGKNNRGNDQVSTRLTARDDLWFHALGLPGCHLVLKRDGRKGEIPEEDILFAAELAAGYSRGRGAARVEVAVALGARVAKPKGARPGLVTAEHFRSVAVPPRRLDEAPE